MTSMIAKSKIIIEKKIHEEVGGGGGGGHAKLFVY